MRSNNTHYLQFNDEPRLHSHTFTDTLEKGEGKMHSISILMSYIVVPVPIRPSNMMYSIKGGAGWMNYCTLFIL